ncbi:MAG: transglutaminase domain-containing protein, partial [Bacteroidota bacterium]
MKTFSTFLYSTFLFITITNGQSLLGYGNIKLSDFEFEYQEDPEADAIVLFDVGKVKFVESIRGGFNIQFHRQRRIFIKNKAGLEHADVTIPYYIDGRGESEVITNVEGMTHYLVNGSLKQQSLTPQNVFTEKSTEYWHHKKLTFPNAKEGAIIEYRYTLESPFIFQLPDWEFQSSIPTVHSQYSFALIPFYEYIYLLQGAEKFHSFTGSEQGVYRTFGGIRFRDVVYTATMKNIDAFEDESYISSRSDYITKIDFQLSAVHNTNGTSRKILTTYPKLIKALNGHINFGKYLKKAEKEAKKLIKNIPQLSSSSTAPEKIIIDFVKNNFEWNGKSRKYTEEIPKTVIEQRKGNTAELNLLLAALLRQANIKAHPVILSTRNHGKINREYPFDHQFNSVAILVKTEEQSFLTDATSPLSAYNRLPIRCLNNVGLVVKESEEQWVNMYSNIISKNIHKIVIDINPIDKKAKVEVNNSMSETEGYLYRNIYGNDQQIIEKEIANMGLENIQNIDFQHYLEKDRPYKVGYSAQVPLEHFDDKLLVTPFLKYPLSENLLKQSKRSYPVDFIYRRIENYGSQINIPEGFQVSELPAKLTVNDSLIEIYYEAKKEAETIRVLGIVNFKKAIYQPNEYNRIKNHIDMIV